MTDKVQKIKEYLVEMSGADCCDTKTKKVIKTNILPFIDSLQEEPVSVDLDKAVRSYSNNIDNICGSIGEQTRNAFKAGARWADEHPRKGFVDINSVCGWLITHLNDYIETGFIGEYTTFEEFRIDDLIKDLHKSYDC